jgi:hypothetical protein
MDSDSDSDTDFDSECNEILAEIRAHIDKLHSFRCELQEIKDEMKFKRRIRRIKRRHALRCLLMDL